MGRLAPELIRHLLTESASKAKNECSYCARLSNELYTCELCGKKVCDHCSVRVDVIEPKLGTLRLCPICASKVRFQTVNQQ